MSAAERAAKTQLGVDTSRNLNLYTADLPNGLLGWATFPADLKGDPAGTELQVARIRAQVGLYRPLLLPRAVRDALHD